MNSINTNQTFKEKLISLIWQHFLLTISLFIMTFGVVLCVRSNLGSSVISSVPLALKLAGESGLTPALTLGEYTNILNSILVLGQIIVLRRRFEIVQLCQLLIGFVFGFLIDLNMSLTSTVQCDTLVTQTITQLLGCTILGIGVSFEIRCGSLTMPGEGFPVAISRVASIPFAKAKICVDITLVTLAVILCYTFFSEWLWNVVGAGTLFAMIYVGLVVKWVDKRIRWFNRILYFRPGIRRYVYGLARYIHNKVS